MDPTLGGLLARSSGTSVTARTRQKKGVSKAGTNFASSSSQLGLSSLPSMSSFGSVPSSTTGASRKHEFGKSERQKGINEYANMSHGIGDFVLLSPVNVKVRKKEYMNLAREREKEREKGINRYANSVIYVYCLYRL